MKVDVEGADDACVAEQAVEGGTSSQHRLPECISAEEVKLPILASLVRVGYQSAKCQDRTADTAARLTSGAWGDAAIDAATNSTRWRDSTAFLAERQRAALAFTPRHGAKSFHVCPGADIHMRLGAPVRVVER